MECNAHFIKELSAVADHDPVDNERAHHFDYLSAACYSNFVLSFIPVNRFCNCGKPFSKVFNMSQTLLLLPLLACRWAVGQKCENDLEQGEEERPSYGGTDSIEMSAKAAPRTD